MKTSEFRSFMREGQRDLYSIEGALAGARAELSGQIVEETERIYHECVSYLDSLVLGYLGEKGRPALGASPVSRWPKPHQSPASIWADMEFLIQHYWDKVREHDDVDPALSVDSMNFAFAKVVSVLRQKLFIGKGVILTKDPAFWTEEMERKLGEVETHYTHMIERIEGDD